MPSTGSAALAATTQDSWWDLTSELAGVITGQRFTDVNPVWSELLGWTRDELLARSPLALIHADDRAALVGAAHHWPWRSGAVLRVENRVLHRDGSVRSVLWSARFDGRRCFVVGRDVTAQRAAERSVFDDTVLLDAHERELRSARDYLRAVTDSMGEGLCTVDDEGSIAYLNAAAEQMLGWTIDEVRGRQLHETTHFRHPDGSDYAAADCPLVHARAVGELLRVEHDVFIRKDGSELPVAYTSAPIEMHDGMRGAVIVFTDISERERRQAEIERDLEALAWLSRIREALAEDRFVLHAQPIIDLRTGETVQHELLIRMVDESGGLVPPGAFLPVAEQYGAIREIDRWVIRQAARLAGQGNPVELNLSADSLGDSELYDVVERELRNAGAEPGLVILEVTETCLLENLELADAFIDRVRRLGCRVALDDFGTGYNGFTHLKRLAVNYLKIDIEFVRDLSRSPASQHVVRAIVQLARDLGQKTVAEGVEDEQSRTMLRDLGVDYAQGYAIGRPVDISQTTMVASRAAA